MQCPFKYPTFHPFLNTPKNPLFSLVSSMSFLALIPICLKSLNTFHRNPLYTQKTLFSVLIGLKTPALTLQTPGLYRKWVFLALA